MGDLCSRIVGALADWWGIIGWGLFIALFLMPFLAAGAGVGLWLVIALVLLMWWAIDAIDQQVPSWTIGLGVLMLAIGVLPRAGLLTIACWVLYWTKVRE